MTWVKSCDTFEDDGLQRVKRAILQEVHRGMEHEEDPLNLDIIMFEEQSNYWIC